MPYPTEHASRIKQPGSFEQDSFRRKNIAPGIDMILGKLKGQTTMTAQAYRFKKDKFTPAQAKKWLKDHNIKYISFEDAAKESDNEYENELENFIDNCFVEKFNSVYEYEGK